MMFNFRENANELEREGVYIGGWRLQNILRPSKNNEGQYGKVFFVINKNFN